jgi:hypothetical protein
MKLYLQSIQLRLIVLLVSLVAFPKISLAQCDKADPPIDCRNAETAVLRINVENSQGNVDDGSVAAARQKFWATYPNAAGHEEARKRFAEALYQKDLLNLFLFSYPDEKLQARYGPEAIGNFIGILSGGANLADGGIPRSAMPEFVDFVTAFRESLSVRGGALLHYGPQTPQEAARVQDALRAARKKYYIYVLARDWAEFDAQHEVPANFNQPSTYPIVLYHRFGGLTFREASDNVSKMTALFTANVVERAAQKVMDYPKDRQGLLVATHRTADATTPRPEAILGEVVGPDDAFERLCSYDDNRRYLLTVLANNKRTLGNEPRQRGKWDFAEAAYNRIVDAYGGPDRVLQAAGKVRTATKLLQDGYVMHPESIGARRGRPYAAFQDILIRSDTRGYVRSMFAFENGFPTKRDLNSEYASFVSKYGEPRVFAAVAEMLAEQRFFGGYTGPDVMYSGDRNELTRRLGDEVKENTAGTAVGGKGAAIGKSSPPKSKPPE